MQAEKIAELWNLYHTARTALADKPADQSTPYYRKLWAAREFAKANPGISEKRAYLAFERGTF